MKIIKQEEFDDYWKKDLFQAEDDETLKTVKEIIRAVRVEGDAAVRRFASMFDRSSPETLEVPASKIKEAVQELEASDPGLAGALRFSSINIRRFSMAQREQFKDFEFENVPGVFTGHKVIPASRAGIYVPGGRYPLVSSALMCLIPAFCAGVEELCFSSPPGDDGIPDTRILASAGIAAKVCGRLDTRFRAFSVGGAQAIAALALGTESIPACDVVAGPGNKYVAAAKAILFGTTGIDFIAGPSDILVIMDEDSSAELAAMDMLAQAEHDLDARARALVPSEAAANRLIKALETGLQKLPVGNSRNMAQGSLDNGGLIVIYKDRSDAQLIANAIAPEHLELQVSNSTSWIQGLRNYGSLFIGALSAEVLGDYSSGLNHTLPTSGTARFTAGLSVRHFLKTPTCLRCEKEDGYREALEAAEIIAKAEGLSAHAESARLAFRR
jgi:histidinol dehydrogenase